MPAEVGLVLGGAAIVGMAAITAGCSRDEDKPSPSPGGPTASPTEKAPTLTPGGPNSFTPSVLAPPAPTALPGNVVTGG